MADEVIDADPFRIRDDQFQPASLDLTLGATAHRLRCSFLPDSVTVAEKLANLSEGKIDIRDGGFLERNVPYLIELREALRLPSTLRAKANPKSSTGRLDVFTRLITDNSFQFDEVAKGYHGPLYLEVVPISFPIRVQQGLSLNQLRVIAGDVVTLADDEIRTTHDRSPILFADEKPVSAAQLAVSSGLFLSLDLRGRDGAPVAFKAKRNTRLLDLTRDSPIDPAEFWEPIHSEAGDQIVLEPEEFYLVMSRESVRIPQDLACEMVAYDPTSGELRTHYAGFFDPGFGEFGRHALGSRAALEIRAHNVPFIIQHGQGVCKLSFERMSSVPRRTYGALSHYQGQDSALSKYFKRF